MIQALLQLTKWNTLPKPRQAIFSKIRDPQTGDAIDHALVLWFPSKSLSPVTLSLPHFQFPQALAASQVRILLSFRLMVGLLLS